MLHINDQNYRESSIGELLYRHIRIDDELYEGYSEKESFIIEKLGIPKTWIYWTKAVKSKAMNKHQLEIKYLLKAYHWNKAHDLLIQHIAPDLIVNDNTKALKSFLVHFTEVKDIQNWNIGGKILQNFISLNEKVYFNFCFF